MTPLSWAIRPPRARQGDAAAVEAGADGGAVTMPGTDAGVADDDRFCTPYLDVTPSRTRTPDAGNAYTQRPRGQSVGGRGAELPGSERARAARHVQHRDPPPRCALIYFR